MPPIAIWGLGWGVAAFIAAFTIQSGDTPLVYVPLSLITGALAFGLPTFEEARRRESSHPFVEAAVWTVGFLAVVLFLAHAFRPDLSITASDVNAITSEDIRQGKYVQTGYFPREAQILGQAVAAFGLTCGTLSGLAAFWPMRNLWAVAGFAAVGVATTIFGLLATVIVLPILGTVVANASHSDWDRLEFAMGAALGGLMAGALGGTLSESARRLLSRVPARRNAHHSRRA